MCVFHSIINLPIIYHSIYPFINPSIHSSIHPSIHPSIHSSIHSSIHPSIHLSIILSVHLSIHHFICPSIHSPSIVVCIYLSVHLSSIRPFINLLFYLSILLSFHPSVHHLSFHPSTILSFHPSITLSFYSPIYPLFYQSIHPSVCLSVRSSLVLSILPSIILSVCPSGSVLCSCAMLWLSQWRHKRMIWAARDDMISIVLNETILLTLPNPHCSPLGPAVKTKRSLISGDTSSVWTQTLQCSGELIYLMYMKGCSVSLNDTDVGSFDRWTIWTKWTDSYETVNERVLISLSCSLTSAQHCVLSLYTATCW